MELKGRNATWLELAVAPAVAPWPDRVRCIRCRVAGKTAVSALPWMNAGCAPMTVA